MILNQNSFLRRRIKLHKPNDILGKYIKKSLSRALTNWFPFIQFSLTWKSTLNGNIFERVKSWKLQATIFYNLNNTEMSHPLAITSLPRPAVMWNNLQWLFDPAITNILGPSPFQILLLKYGIKNLAKSKKQAPIQFLKVKFKNRFHRVALVDKWV